MCWSFDSICNLLIVFFFVVLWCVQLIFEVGKRMFVLMHCWLKLNMAPKWQLSIVNSIKTAIIGTKEEAGDPTDPAKESPKKG